MIKSSTVVGIASSLVYLIISTNVMAYVYKTSPIISWQVGVVVGGALLSFMLGKYLSKRYNYCD